MKKMILILSILAVSTSAFANSYQCYGVDPTNGGTKEDPAFLVKLGENEASALVMDLSQKGQDPCWTLNSTGSNTYELINHGPYLDVTFSEFVERGDTVGIGPWKMMTGELKLITHSIDDQSVDDYRCTLRSLY